jgi:hypothetical protein
MVNLLEKDGLVKRKAVIRSQCMFQIQIQKGRKSAVSQPECDINTECQAPIQMNTHNDITKNTSFKYKFLFLSLFFFTKRLPFKVGSKKTDGREKGKHYSRLTAHACIDPSISHIGNQTVPASATRN